MKRYTFRRSLAILALSLAAVLSIYLYYAKDSRDTLYPQTVENTAEIIGTWYEARSPIEAEKLSKMDLQKLLTREHRAYLVTYNDRGDDIKREVVYKGYQISSIQMSPSQEKLGFFYYPDGHSLGSVALVVFDTVTSTAKEIYRNSIRTSNYEWRDDGTIAVNYNCGTGCLYQYLIHADSGNILDEYLLRSPFLSDGNQLKY